jgi:hypothetical protein
MATKTMFFLILYLSLIAGWLCEEMRPRPVQRTPRPARRSAPEWGAEPGRANLCGGYL